MTETAVDIRVMGDKIAVQPNEPITETPGGVLLPDDINRSRSGKVLAVGKDVDEVSVADNVHFNKYAGTEVNGILILDSTDVLMIS